MLAATDDEFVLYTALVLCFENRWRDVLCGAGIDAGESDAIGEMADRLLSPAGVSK